MARLRARSCARVAAAGAASALALATPAGSGADPHGSVAALRNENATLAQRTQQAVLDLYSLESLLGRARARLATLQAQSAQVRDQVALVRRARGIAQHVLAVSQRTLGERLRALYEDGDVDPLAVLLGSHSLDEALTSLDALQRVSAQSESVIRETRAAKAHLDRLRNELDVRVAQLGALRRGAEQTTASLESTRAQRVELISSLRTRQRLNASALASAEATARAAAARSTELTVVRAASNPAPAPTASTSSPPAASDPASAPAPAGAQTLDVVATGYSIHGRTATGVPTGWGVAAVDPSVIPLGTRFDVPGYGVAVAADTGGAVQGATIDLWFPTQAQALAWGRRTVTITLP